MNGSRDTSHDSLSLRATARQSVVQQVLRRWDEGQGVSARAVLDNHPALATERSVIIELAYEEYRRRKEAGDEFDKAEFCGRFPEVEHSLFEVLEVDSFLSANSQHHAQRAVTCWPQLGETFMGFRLVDELGRGAFSRVYLAQQADIGNRFVALKVSDQEFQEADKLGRLSHPNIVPVHSVHVDEETGLGVLCMPYFGRHTLAGVIDRLGQSEPSRFDGSFFCDARADANDCEVADAEGGKRQTPRRDYVEAASSIGAELADALAYAHEQGILHLDLKPSNILLGFDGQPYLLDFNLAAEVGEVHRRIGGTLPYMAPEALRRAATLESTNVRVGPAADIYALGIVLYELLTGRHPFPAPPRNLPLRDAVPLRLQQVAAPVTPISRINRFVDLKTAAVVERCLHFDSRRRPASAAELAAQLRKSLQPLGRVERLALRHPVVARVAKIGAVVALIGLLVWLTTREPYAVRRNHAGHVAMASGRYDVALSCFSDAMQAQPENVDHVVGYVTALTRLERFKEAEEVLRNAPGLQNAASILALRIYVLARLKEYPEVIKLREPFAAAGGNDFATINNLAVVFLARDHLSDAEALLDDAVERKESTAVVHFNRARLEVTHFVKTKELPSPIGLQCAERAIAMGLTQGQAYLYAAVLAAAQPNAESAHGDSIRQQLRLAAENGATMAMFRGFSVLAPFVTAALGDVVQRDHTDFAVDTLIAPF